MNLLTLLWNAPLSSWSLADRQGIDSAHENMLHVASGICPMALSSPSPVTNSIVFSCFPFCWWKLLLARCRHLVLSQWRVSFTPPSSVEPEKKQGIPFSSADGHNHFFPNPLPAHPDVVSAFPWASESYWSGCAACWGSASFAPALLWSPLHHFCPPSTTPEQQGCPLLQTESRGARQIQWVALAGSWALHQCPQPLPLLLRDVAEVVALKTASFYLIS